MTVSTRKLLIDFAAHFETREEKVSG